MPVRGADRHKFSFSQRLFQAGRSHYEHMRPGPNPVGEITRRRLRRGHDLFRLGGDAKIG
jgi:hypothetical protein